MPMKPLEGDPRPAYGIPRHSSIFARSCASVALASAQGLPLNLSTF